MKTKTWIEDSIRSRGLLMRVHMRDLEDATRRVKELEEKIIEDANLLAEYQEDLKRFE